MTNPDQRPPNIPLFLEPLESTTSEEEIWDLTVRIYSIVKNHINKAIASGLVSDITPCILTGGINGTEQYCYVMDDDVFYKLSARTQLLPAEKYQPITIETHDLRVECIFPLGDENKQSIPVINNYADIQVRNNQKSGLLFDDNNLSQNLDELALITAALEESELVVTDEIFSMCENLKARKFSKQKDLV